MNTGVKGIEVKYYINNLDKITDFTRCKIDIKRDLGKVKIEFNRGIENSLIDGEFYPIEEEYEYFLTKDYLDEKLFSKVDLSDIKNEENDLPLAGLGKWKITIYTELEKLKFKGYKPPKNIGTELSDILKNIVKCEKEILIF
ncbi:MAG: hypothetical protein Q4P31_02675 [Andreesenia angusta]|nr:hypothetical protein [Andreesenia angusta]